MAKSRTLRSSVKPNSEFDRVISGMRSIDEVELHTRIVIPLLRALGAEAVTYVHGAFERGKDIIYVRKDSFYGDSSLEVCQVKNQRFSGNATSSNNTIGVLTQLEQARKTKVLNPLTSKKELPNAVVLLTTYDLPDKDVADCDTYLDSLSAKRIKVIGPEKLVELLRTNLFEEYIRFASDGDVAAQSMYVYVNTRHESAAFDSSHRRDLESFFINLGIAAPDSVLSRIDNGTLTPAPSWRTSSWFQEIRSNQYRQVHSLQAVIYPCVRLPELLVLEKFGKATQT